MHSRMLNSRPTERDEEPEMWEAIDVALIAEHLSDVSPVVARGTSRRGEVIGDTAHSFRAGRRPPSGIAVSSRVVPCRRRDLVTAA